MSTSKRVTSRDDEARQQATRALLYAAIFRLIDVAERPDVATLRSEVGAVHCPVRLLAAHDELSSALKGMDLDRLLEARTRWAASYEPIGLDCDREAGSAWARASAVAGLQGTINPLGELKVLARLAALIEEAVRSGDESRARELRSQTRQLLSQHSGLCLETLGARLAANGGPIFSGVGRALERLIETDVRES